MLTGSDSCAIGYDCMGISFLDSMGDHTYILGDTFLREYYLVFDESNNQIGLGSMEEEMSVAIPRPPINELWKWIKIGSYVLGAIAILSCLVGSCWKLRKSSHFWAWREHQLDLWGKSEQTEQLLNQPSGSTIDTHQHYQYQAMENDDEDLRVEARCTSTSPEPTISAMENGDGNLYDEDYRSRIRELRSAFLDSKVVSN